MKLLEVHNQPTTVPIYIYNQTLLCNIVIISVTNINDILQI